MPSSPRADSPIVTVVIPAFNAEAWLSLTLESACSQTLREIEILVVDDDSRDGTARIALDYAARDPRVRLIQRENGGVGAARNSGIREARGKYIAPLDADDLWFPEKLEAQVACMEAGGEEMGMSYCWSEKIDSQGQRLTDSFPFEIEGRAPVPLILRNFIGNASVPMFRASALADVGLYLNCEEQEGSQGCEDWDLCIRVAEKYTIGLVRRPLVGYRQVEACMSLNIPWMSLSYEIAMRRARERNPGIPREVFRWSAGNFYSYLCSKCFLWTDYPGCLKSMIKAISSDPMLITNRRLHLMGLKSLVRIMTGTRGRLPGPASPDAPSAPATQGKMSWSDSIQAKRWEKAIGQGLF
ncbi:glycosyltransferase family 2 protein [Luteolibacter soli]|uniref:Glycosyltransferase family 2 protein n=1 Tax=Luteolibacter soli TaxID=3135280 RepID=A0ABU9B215_9BACT